MLVEPGTPGSQILGDGQIGDARLLRELTQRCRARPFPGLDASLDQLHALARVLEGKNSAHGGITENHRTRLVRDLGRAQDLIRFQSSNFLAKVMPAFAGLVDGKHS